MPKGSSRDASLTCSFTATATRGVPPSICKEDTRFIEGLSASEGSLDWTARGTRAERFEFEFEFVGATDRDAQHRPRGGKIAGVHALHGHHPVLLRDILLGRPRNVGRRGGHGS